MAQFTLAVITVHLYLCPVSWKLFIKMPTLKKLRARKVLNQDKSEAVGKEEYSYCRTVFINFY